MKPVWAAAAVHIFTASGVVCALLALLAIQTNAFERAFVWLGLALVIDGLDGYFARAVDVKRVLPRFSGEQLDLVVDYVTYVFVPVVLLLQSGHLNGVFGVGMAVAILLSSLFHFSDTQSKTAENQFVGFPAIWNIVAFYVLALGLGTFAAAGLIAVCVALTFVPLRWVHPLRVRSLRSLSVAASALWAVAAIAAVWQGFPATGPAQVVLIGVAVYGLGLSLVWGRVSAR